MARTFQSVVAGLMMSGTAIAQDVPDDLAGQLLFMKGIGLELAPGITADDLTFSFPEPEFIGDWPRLMLFALGIEVERAPWGRRFSNDVWNFDFESVDDREAYQHILNNLVALTGNPALLIRNDSLVDFDQSQAEIVYQIGDTRRTMTVPQESDWADASVVEQMMKDIQAATGRDRAFWFMDNGQAMVLMFLTPRNAAKLNAIAPDVIAPMF